MQVRKKSDKQQNKIITIKSFFRLKHHDVKLITVELADKTCYIITELNFNYCKWSEVKS